MSFDSHGACDELSALIVFAFYVMSDGRLGCGSNDFCLYNGSLF